MTATEKFYQHEHERITSRSLRYTSSGTAGTAYNSCEAIGVIPPRPPDTTYGNSGRPTDLAGLYPALPAISTLYPGGLLTIPDAASAYLVPEGMGIFVENFDGAVWDVGYVQSCSNDGVYTMIQCSQTFSILPTAVVQLGWVSQEDIHTPNVLITYPCMVNVEFSVGSIGKELCEVKVYRRDSSWRGSLQHITLDTGLTLPCTLEPGWYAFKAQSTNWADHPLPSTDKTNGDAIPFVITFERPRYVCDFKSGWIQRDTAPSIPPGAWGHDRGMGTSIIDQLVRGPAMVCDGNIIETSMAGLGMGDILPNTTWYAKTSTGREYSTFARGYESIGRACYEYGDYIHVSEQLITKAHRNTGGIVKQVIDTHNRGVDYASGISVDVFLEGNISIAVKDLISFGDDTQVTTTEYYQVDSVEPYFGDPTGSGTDAFYTLLTIYGAYPDDLSQWDDMYVWKLTRTVRGGRWLRYDLNWANMTVLHTSTRQLGYLRDGETIDKIESRTPEGAECVVERLADDSDIWYIKLPFGAPYGLAAVRTAANQLLHIRAMDCFINPVVYPIPDESSLVYQVDAAGDNGDETWLILHPSLAGAKLYVLYSYYSDDCYVERFWMQYYIIAIETGSGIGYKYDTITNLLSSLQDLRTGELGLNTQPVIIAPYSNEYYSISNPSGYFSIDTFRNINNLDRIDIRNKRITELLSIVAQAFGQYIYLDVDNKLWVKNRAFGVVGQISPIRPTPELNSPIGADSVRVTYNSGQAQDGKSRLPRKVEIPEIDTYDHALWLAQTYRYNDTQDEIIIDIPISEDLDILTAIQTQYPEPILDDKQIYGQIIGKKYNLDEQQIQLRCRRLG